MKPLIRKSWYTLTEAADYLTKATEGDPVTVSDILQLAVEGEISLSFHFFTEVHAEAGRIRFNPELAIAHLPPEEWESYLLHPASMQTNADTDCPAEYKIDHWYLFEVEEDFDVTASPGEFWELTAHGWGKELETELWRLSLEAPASTLNKPASLVSPRNKLPGDRSNLLPNIRLIGALEPQPFLYLLPYPAEEEEKDAPWVIEINWSELPDDTLIGVAREMLDNLLADQEQDTSTAASDQPDPDRQEYPPQLEALPHKFLQLYAAIAGGELPDLEAAINAWHLHWHERPARGERDTYPKNPNIQAWLEDRGVSRNKAESIPPLIRPKWG